MINIAQKEFNLDMESYLKKRRTPEEKKTTKKKKKSSSEEEFIEEEKEFLQKRSFFEKIMDFLVGEDSAPDTKAKTEEEVFKEPPEKVENLPVKERKGFFATIREWFYSDDSETEVVVEEEIIKKVDDDLKEVLKIQNKWLQKLPAKKIKEFKTSDDYKKVKEILKKYNLIREN